MNEKAPLTVGQLVDHLAVFSRDAEVFFGDSQDLLTFARTKLRGDNLVQIEFEESLSRTERSVTVQKL